MNALECMLNLSPALLQLTVELTVKVHKKMTNKQHRTKLTTSNHKCIAGMQNNYDTVLYDCLDWAFVLSIVAFKFHQSFNC